MDRSAYTHPRTSLRPSLIYTFDKDFTKHVRASIALEVSSFGQSVMCFATARSKENWKVLVGTSVPELLEKRGVPVDSAVQMFWRAKKFFCGLELAYTVRVKLQGSGESHTIYVYRNPAASKLQW